MFAQHLSDRSVQATLSRGYGTLAGLGFIGAAVLAVPSTLLLEPRPPGQDYLVTVAGLFTGLVCMSLPWERLDLRWLHVVGVLATVQAAAAVAVFGQPYSAIFFLIAVGVAYIVPDNRGLVAHLLFIGVALFAPVLYGPASVEETLQVGLVVYPLLALTAGVVAYLRQRLVADHRSYRLFAEETLALAQRIGGTPVPSVPRRPAEGIGLPEWSRLRVSTRASGAAAFVLAVPLVTAGLAAAGMKVPAFAADALGEVGIELPNQEHGTSDPAIATRVQLGGRPEGADRGANDQSPGTEPAARAKRGQGNARADEGGADLDRATSGASGGGATGSGDTPSVTDLTGAAGAGPSGVEAPEGDTGGGHPVTDALDDTMSGLSGLLGGQKDTLDGAPRLLPDDASAE